MKSVLAIRHVAFEDLGSFEAVFQHHGFDVTYVDACVDDLSAVDAAAPDLLVVLGGPIGVYEEDTYPFIRREVALLQARLERQLPTLGICLGAQLIARAMGARVYPGPAKEIGWKPLQLTEAGRHSAVAHLDGASTSMLHWHGDTFDLPEGATLLASTDLCAHQIFSVGAHVLAFQCHPEVLGDTLERWLVGHACELAANHIDVPELRADGLLFSRQLAQQGALCLTQWLVQTGLVK